RQAGASQLRVGVAADAAAFQEEFAAEAQLRGLEQFGRRRACEGSRGNRRGVDPFLRPAEPREGVAAGRGGERGFEGIRALVQLDWFGERRRVAGAGGVEND